MRRPEPWFGLRRVSLWLRRSQHGAVPLFWLPRPLGTLYSVEGPLRWLLRFIQAVGVTGFIWTLRHFDNGTFLRLAQIRTGATGPENEPSSLTTDGPFGWCRHPLYLFFTIALVSSPTM